MPTFTQQINQENQDLAEIQKVARMTPQKMFWQWVSVASWFLGGVLVAMVLNIISYENGKLKLSPTDFEKDFKKELKEELPKIVEETVLKQRFNLKFNQLCYNLSPHSGDTVRAKRITEGVGKSPLSLVAEVS